MFTPMIKDEIPVTKVRILQKYYGKVNYEVVYDYHGYKISAIYQGFEIDNKKFKAYCAN